MRTIVLNRSNIESSNGYNNQFVYKFPTTVNFKDDFVAVSSVSLYYSWYNISEALGNNRFSYNWADSGTNNYQTYNVVIPDGLYEIADINAFLQSVFIANGHYLVNATSQNVYYAEVVVNSSRYKIQINTFSVPTSLPAGFSAPANWAGYPASPFNPVITIPSGFSDIVGYTAGFSTTQNQGNTTNLSFLSQGVPDVQPNSSILFNLSNIDNQYSSPSGIIYSVAPNVAIGQLIVDKPSSLAFQPLLNGNYNELRLQILGTDLKEIQIQDPEITILLVIRNKDDPV